MEKFGDNSVKLSTGRVLYVAGYKVVSFDSMGRLLYGYDGHVFTVNGDEDEDDDYTPQEKQEIALYMMQQWAEWAGGGFDIKINTQW